MPIAGTRPHSIPQSQPPAHPSSILLRLSEGHFESPPTPKLRCTVPADLRERGGDATVIRVARRHRRGKGCGRAAETSGRKRGRGQSYGARGEPSARPHPAPLCPFQEGALLSTCLLEGELAPGLQMAQGNLHGGGDGGTGRGGYNQDSRAPSVLSSASDMSRVPQEPRCTPLPQ